MTKGNPDLQHYSQKGYDAEITALYILKNEGYEILYAPEKSKRERIKIETERKEMGLEKKLESFGYCSEFVDKNKKVHRGTDKKELIKFKEKHLNSKQKNEVMLLIQKWEQNYKQFRTQIEKKEEVMEILTKIIGDSVVPKISEEDHKRMIEEEKESDWKKFFKETFEMTSQHTFVDIFCKKGNDYYIFDIKHKTYKENTNLNAFAVTNYEVLNYDRIVKENKVKMKIMIIVGKQKKSVYKIFDWTDFQIPKTFDPHTKMKTSIHLKNGLNMDVFNNFFNEI